MRTGIAGPASAACPAARGMEIEMKHRLVLLAGLAAGLLPCAAFAQAKFDGYLCCNMRTDGSWISDGNYAESGTRVMPAGTPVKITGYARHRVRV